MMKTINVDTTTTCKNNCKHYLNYKTTHVNYHIRMDLESFFSWSLLLTHEKSCLLGILLNQVNTWFWNSVSPWAKKNLSDDGTIRQDEINKRKNWEYTFSSVWNIKSTDDDSARQLCIRLLCKLLEYAVGQ